MQCTKRCPVCRQENPVDQIICKTQFCTHVFRYDHDQQLKTVVASIGRSYPVGTEPK
jgi:predicted nucleic acid-binding Zn ribbon protein